MIKSYGRERTALWMRIPSGDEILSLLNTHMAHTFTAANFEKEVLRAKKPVLVDFWAPWCGPCQMQGPILDELAEEVGDAVKIGKLNVDDGAAVASEFGIMSVPTLILFQGGAAVSQVSGLQTKAKLLGLLKKVMQA